MRDCATQVVLGIFAGVFPYCLIILRTIHGANAAGFIPSLTVTFGVVLVIGGIGALTFFIHHIARSIQTSSIIASVADETLAAIDLRPAQHLFLIRQTAWIHGRRDPCAMSVPRLK